MVTVNNLTAPALIALFESKRPSTKIVSPNNTQGDPLRVFFAAAVFHEILEPLDKKIMNQSKIQKTNNQGHLR